MVEEARLEQSEYGLTAATEGWFVVNVRDGAWMTNEALGDAFIVEGGDDEFPQLGYTIGIFQPGQASRYHREANQEDFLVLQGECVALIEGEERPLKAWDFVHCPAGTDHAFVGAGDGPCVIFMVGAREGWPKGDRLPALRGRAAARRGRRDGDDVAPRGVRGVPEVEAGPARRLRRPSLGQALVRPAPQRRGAEREGGGDAAQHDADVDPELGVEHAVCVTCASASYAYVSGSRFETHCSGSAISSRGTRSPPRRICGITTAGMNWTAWNSVVANALRKRPSAIPRSAFATASRTTSSAGPAVSRPSSVKATVAVIEAWTAATSANASA